MPITTELFLRIVATAKEETIANRKRYSRQGDLTQIHMALGAEDLCELLERSLRNHLEAAARIRQDNEQKQRERLLRAHQRQEARHANRQAA